MLHTAALSCVCVCVGGGGGSVLRSHARHAFVVTRASIALGSLARVRSNANWLGPAGSCEALAQVLELHLHDCDVSKFVVSAMGQLCGAENNKQRLGASGACELVVEAARRHLAALDMARAAGLAMGRLCERLRNRPLALEETLLHSATDAAAAAAATSPRQQRYSGWDADYPRGAGTGAVDGSLSQSSSSGALAVQDGEVPAGMGREQLGPSSSSRVGADASAAEVRTADEDSEHAKEERPADTTQHSMAGNVRARAGGGAGQCDNRARLFRADYCRVLVDLLQQHSSDRTAVQIVCRTITVIAFSDMCRREREALGAHGACTALAKAAHYHEGSEEVGRSLCWAVKALAYHHPRNREQLRVGGVSPPVVLVLRGFRYSRDAAETVQAAAAAVAHLAQDSEANRLDLGRAGACEGLLEVAELHLRNIEVAYLCAKALFHVCDGSADNRNKVSVSGGADILLGLASRYLDEERIMDYTVSVMLGLCTCRVGQARLGAVGVAKTVVAALYRYERASEYMTLLCCALVGALALNCPDNQALLVQAGACKAIASALNRYAHSTTFRAVNHMPRAAPSAAPLLQETTRTTGVTTDFMDSREPGVASMTAWTAAGPGEESDATGTEAETFPTDGWVQQYQQQYEQRCLTAQTAAGKLLSHAANAVSASADMPSQQQLRQAAAARYMQVAVRLPLAHLLGGFSVRKECCKAIVHLAATYEPARSKLQALQLADGLAAAATATAAVISKSSSSSSGAGVKTISDAAVQKSQVEEEAQWAKHAMDVLLKDEAASILY